MALIRLAVPLLFLGACLPALIRGEPVYPALLRGGAKGLRLLASILPSLVFLLCGVELLRASGALEAMVEALRPAAGWFGLPPETLPLVLVRPISGSAALAVGADLMACYGPDSQIGRTAAVMLGSTETTFYTISVYFSAVGIRRSRYAIPAALTADLVGFVAASLCVRLFF